MNPKEVNKAVVCGGTGSEYPRRKQEERYARLALFEAEFFELFGQSLYLYCDRLTGFDPCKFWDATVGKTPDGISYHSAVRDLYGYRAAELIHDLICTITGDSDAN